MSPISEKLPNRSKTLGRPQPALLPLSYSLPDLLHDPQHRLGSNHQVRSEDVRDIQRSQRQLTPLLSRTRLGRIQHGHERLDEQLPLCIPELIERFVQRLQRCVELALGPRDGIGVAAPPRGVDSFERGSHTLSAVAARVPQVGGGVFDDGEEVRDMQAVLLLDGVGSLVYLLEEVGVVRVAGWEGFGGCCGAERFSACAGFLG